MGATRRILMPLPDRGFDVTEVAVPWPGVGDQGAAGAAGAKAQLA